MQRQRSSSPLRWLFRPRVLKFGLVGLSGVLVNLGFLWLFTERLRMGEALGSAIAIEISIAWNFLLNNAFTFRDRNQGAQVGLGARLVRYNVVSLVGLGIQLVTFLALNALVLRLLHRTEIGRLRYATQCVGIVIAMTWNFASNFLWTWGQTKPAKPEAGLPPAPGGLEHPG
jgi:dolichol-phosphate mannosyltransferase